MDTYNFWFEWRLNFSINELQPINVPEKHVVFDVLFSVFSTTQALGRVFGQELQGKTKSSYNSNVIISVRAVFNRVLKATNRSQLTKRFLKLFLPL